MLRGKEKRTETFRKKLIVFREKHTLILELLSE